MIVVLADLKRAATQRADHEDLVKAYRDRLLRETISWSRPPNLSELLHPRCYHEKCSEDVVEELIAADGSVSYYCKNHASFWERERKLVVARNTIISRRQIK